MDKKLKRDLLSEKMKELITSDHHLDDLSEFYYPTYLRLFESALENIIFKNFEITDQIMETTREMNDTVKRYLILNQKTLDLLLIISKILQSDKDCTLRQILDSFKADKEERCAGFMETYKSYEDLF